MKFIILAITLVLGSATIAPCALPGAKCCKVCTKGKACGNTCIPRNHHCHTVGGCACNAED